MFIIIVLILEIKILRTFTIIKKCLQKLGGGGGAKTVNDKMSTSDLPATV